VDIDVVVTPGLGDNSYVITSGDEAAVLDPQRDVDRFVALAEDRGATIRWILETHVHNDYVSGARELQEATGAAIGAPAGGAYEFVHRPMAEGGEVAVGNLRLVAMETPGHTPEHVSYVLVEPGADRPRAAFTGGSLMVRGAGRTDLLGGTWTDRLTRAQFRSLRRLAGLPDEVEVFPTHGAGSFCGAGPAPPMRTSTIGEERRDNPALTAPDEDTFVREQLEGLLAYPTYYRAMAPINRAGPRVVGRPPDPPSLQPAELVQLLDGAARPAVVDARFRAQFARAHIPGSVNVELDESFGSYVGWVVPFNVPIVLVVPELEEEAVSEATIQLFRIGYERVLGFLSGGVAAWRAAGFETRSYPVAGLDELCRRYREARDRPGPDPVDGPAVLDVRQRTEWDAGHIPGSRFVFVGDLPGSLATIPHDREWWVICRTGHRSAIASSMLDAAGIPARLVDGTGVMDFLEHCLSE
jgi:hydroxyacylglutathione hydrolase